MTSPRGGGGVRALGASLLDQVLAETLDPAYQQAADARAHRPPEGPRPPRRRDGRSPVLVALTLLLTGLLLAVAWNEAAAGSPGREEQRAALVDDVQRGTAVGDRLTAELQQLQSEVSAARDDLLDSTDEGQRALARLARAQAGAAALEVTGPGLLVTLADAEPAADDDPVGGQVAEDPRGIVRDRDLQYVVNALWAAGAEAISINGERLGPTSAIRFAGEAVLVDFRPVTNPYEVRAIGNPERLAAGFVRDDRVESLGLVSITFGMRFDYAQADDLTLPAATPAELRWAAPVGSRDGTAAPSSAAPAPGATSSSPATSPPGAAGTPSDQPEAAP